MKLLNLLKDISAAPEYEIAFDKASITSYQWLARVMLWQKRLKDEKRLQRVALYFSDSAELSAVLVALWLCDKEAWLSPNNLPLTTQDLANYVDGFIGDFDQVATLSLDDIMVELLPSAAQHFNGSVLPSDAILVLFTSGSAGKPQMLRKKLPQLAAEVDQLESTFGAHLGHSRVYATVSHQHIYGLLFRVLWPLAYQRAFCQFTIEYLEQLFHNDVAICCLISSPTHLTRLPEVNGQQSQVTLVFSSGGPLPNSASRQANNVFHADVVEVFGSTETGGIGWRRQHCGETAWTLFDVVQAKINEQQCLVVKSPYLANDDWFTTTDLVAVEGETFTLIGRADRVVKVEGKRVSLEQIEAHLLADAWVEDVRVEPVVRAGAIATRDELMALVVLSDSGLVALKEHGRQILTRHFKLQLSQLLERPLVPRRWRYIDQLPRTTQGKILHQELQRLLKQMRQQEAKVQQ